MKKKLSHYVLHTVQPGGYDPDPSGRRKRSRKRRGDYRAGDEIRGARTHDKTPSPPTRERRQKVTAPKCRHKGRAVFPPLQTSARWRIVLSRTLFPSKRWNNTQRNTDQQRLRRVQCSLSANLWVTEVSHRKEWLWPQRNRGRACAGEVSELALRSRGGRSLHPLPRTQTASPRKCGTSAGLHRETGTTHRVPSR